MGQSRLVTVKIEYAGSHDFTLFDNCRNLKIRIMEDKSHMHWRHGVWSKVHSLAIRKNWRQWSSV